METIMSTISSSVSAVSDAVWQVFLPILVLLGLFIGYKNLLVIRKKTTRPASMTFRQFVGPTSISLGAMIGTGAIIGVLGALNKYAAAGQLHVEALVFWTLIGSCIMLPLSYAETMFSKIMDRVPKDMITQFLGVKIAAVYGFAYVLLYVFGFGGFQFSGISNILSMMSEQYLGVEIGVMQRYLFIVVPLVIVTAIIVLTKKHEVFVNAMASMIGFAVLLYFVFFIVFIIRTADFVPVFFSNMVEGIRNPVSMAVGVPMGIILAVQRITQTTESGIGGLPMAAHENDSKPRAAALISIIPVIATIFVAIVVTTYLTSYGMYSGRISLPSDDFTRLNGLFKTIDDITGNFGLLVLAIFAILSGASTLLGSYYYVKVLFAKNSENKNIATYIVMILSAGTLATFGSSMVFDIVDLLIFLVTGIFVVTLAIFAHKEWKKYIITEEE